MRRLSFFSITLGLALAALPRTSSAQPTPPPPPPPPPAGGAKPAGDAKAAGDVKAGGSIKVEDNPIDTKKPEQPATPDANAPPKKQFGEGDSPLDDLDKNKDKDKKPGSTEWFIGARFRDFIVPHFFFSIFASGGPGDVNIFSGGPEATMRTGNFELDMSFTVPYADYSMNTFLFKNKKEPNEAYEFVSSSLKVFMFSADILGSIPVDKKGIFQILIGGGIGLGGVSGRLNRNQVYPKDFNNVNSAGDDRAQWVQCNAANDPAGLDAVRQIQYCDSSNNHYGKYSEPSWANGGSLPVVFGYISLPHIAFRVQPVKVLQLRADTGFSTTGFFAGFAAGLRLPN